jgi:hypothetical protein
VLQDFHLRPRLHRVVSLPAPAMRLPSSADSECACATCCGAWGCLTFMYDSVCIVLLHDLPHQCCLLQLSARVLAIVDHGDARRSSSAACLCVCACLRACVLGDVHLRPHLCCLLQLSARVLAGMEHCEAGHSSSATSAFYCKTFIFGLIRRCSSSATSLLPCSAEYACASCRGALCCKTFIFG